jgi:deoxyribonuclease I
MKISFFVLSFVLISFQIAQSQELPLYYGSEFLTHYQDKSLRNDELKQALFTILSTGHVKHANTPDTIVPNCNSTGNIESVSCEQHHSLGYDQARMRMFGELYLQTLDNGQYGVKDVYCERIFTDLDFKGKPTFGPGKMPSSGNIINTEHTWPQSRFSPKYKDFEKADLHHLFPTDSQLNSARSSLKFGNVIKEKEPLKCPGGHVGKSADSNDDVFEVPDSQKGNTARAIFYFATRYQLKLTPAEEATLRGWNIQDPVDAAEFDRNNKIEALQGNRNPYIDFSDLVDRIEKFQ